MLRFDGPIYRFMVWVMRLALLNVLFWVTALPIVTAFPAAVAMSSVASKWVRGETPAVFSTYVHGLTKHFLKSFVVGLVLIAVVAILGVDYRVMTLHHRGFGWVIGVVAVVGFLISMISLYTSCLMARMEGRLVDIVGTAFKLGAYKIHVTIVHILMVAGFCYVALRFSYLDVFFTFSGVALVNAWYIEGKLKDLLTDGDSSGLHSPDMGV